MQSMLDLREQLASGFARAGVGSKSMNPQGLPQNLGPGVPRPPPLPRASHGPPPPSVNPPPLPRTMGSSKGAIPSIRPVYNDDDD
jgi:hypothetical protein